MKRAKVLGGVQNLESRMVKLTITAAGNPRFASIWKGGEPPELEPEYMEKPFPAKFWSIPH